MYYEWRLVETERRILVFAARSSPLMRPPENRRYCTAALVVIGCGGSTSRRSESQAAFLMTDDIHRRRRQEAKDLELGPLGDGTKPTIGSLRPRLLPPAQRLRRQLRRGHRSLPRAHALARHLLRKKPCRPAGDEASPRSVSPRLLPSRVRACTRHRRPSDPLARPHHRRKCMAGWLAACCRSSPSSFPRFL